MDVKDKLIARWSKAVVGYGLSRDCKNILADIAVDVFREAPQPAEPLSERLTKWATGIWSRLTDDEAKELDEIIRKLKKAQPAEPLSQNCHTCADSGCPQYHYVREGCPKYQGPQVAEPTAEEWGKSCSNSCSPREPKGGRQ